MDENTTKKLHEVFDKPKEVSVKPTPQDKRKLEATIAAYLFDQKMALDICNIFIASGYRSLCQKSRKKVKGRKYYRVITTAPEGHPSWDKARTYLEEKGAIEKAEKPETETNEKEKQNGAASV